MTIRLGRYNQFYTCIIPLDLVSLFTLYNALMLNVLCITELNHLFIHLSV
jgi:hypothetical protein